jgi:hypothetical protein
MQIQEIEFTKQVREKGKSPGYLSRLLAERGWHPLGTGSEASGLPLWYVRMEKLTSLSEFELYSERYLPELWALHWTCRRRLIHCNVDMYNMANLLNINSVAFAKLTDQEFYQKVGRTADPEWMQLVEDLITLAKKLGLRELDLHYNNFMQRGSTLVIIDPFWSPVNIF